MRGQPSYRCEPLTDKKATSAYGGLGEPNQELFHRKNEPASALSAE